MIPDPFSRVQEGSDGLVEGFYLIERWRSARVPIPVRIFWGAPIDPDTGEEMDRAPRWQVAVGGVPIVDHQPVDIGGFIISTLSDFWPTCLSHPVSQAEHDYLVARAGWSAAYDPSDPYGSATGRIDPMTASLPTLGENRNAQ